MMFKSFRSLCHYAHKANIIISQKFNGKFTIEDINNYIAKLDEKISSQSIERNIKNKYLRIKNYLLFLKDYIAFNYKEEDKFALSNNIALLNGYKEFEFNYKKLRDYYLNNNKKDKIIHALKNEKYFLENKYLITKLSKEKNLKNNYNNKEIDDIKKLVIFEKLKFHKLINLKDDLNDFEFFEIYSYFYQLDDIGLKNIYAETIFNNPKKYSVDTNGYITLVLKNNVFKTENHSLVVDFYSDKKFKDDTYTLRELAKHKYDKDIFVVATKPGEIIDEEEKNKRNRLYGNFPCINSEIDVLLNEYYSNKDFEDVCRIYPNIIKVLRNSLSDKKLLEDYDELVKEYNKVLQNLESYKQSSNTLNESVEFNNN